MKNRRKEVPRCYLRRHRRAWGLTQRELAKLIGYKSENHVSRIERSKRPPTMETALACQVIFGIPADTMFPTVYSSVEEKTMRNIYKEHHRLENTIKPAGIRKRELYELALSRAVGRNDNEGAV